MAASVRALAQAAQPRGQLNVAIEMSACESSPITLAQSSMPASAMSTPVEPIVAAARGLGLPAVATFRSLVTSSEHAQRVFFQSERGAGAEHAQSHLPCPSALDEVEQACSSDGLFMDRRSLRASNWERAHTRAIAAGPVEVLIAGPGASNGSRPTEAKKGLSTPPTVPDPSDYAVAAGIAGGAAAVVLAGTSHGHHSMIPGLVGSASAPERATARDVASLAAEAASLASTSASAARAGAAERAKDAKVPPASAAAANVGTAEDCGAGGSYHTGEQDGAQTKWGDAWFTLLTDCALLWAYVSPKQDAAAKVAISSARAGVANPQVVRATHEPPCDGLRGHVATHLFASKADGAVGLRLVARIPLGDESATHAVGLREWQIFSVPEPDGSSAGWMGQPTLLTFRASTAAEMLWWLSLMPTRHIAASDAALLAIPDATIAADAMLQSTRDAVRVRHLSSLWTSLHTYDVRQRLWSGLSEFPGAHHLLLAWLHIRCYELAHPLTRRLAPSLLLSGTPGAVSSDGWPNPLLSPGAAMPPPQLPPRRELLSVADYRSLLQDEDVACVAAHAHATFGRFFCLSSSVSPEASEVPSTPRAGGGPQTSIYGGTQQKRGSGVKEVGGGMLAASGLNPAGGIPRASEARSPLDSARAVLACVSPALVANVGDAVGWGTLKPRRGAELLYFPAPDAFTPARIAIEVAIYARVLMPFAGNLVSNFCSASNAVAVGAGILQEDLTGPSPEPQVHRGRPSATHTRARSFWGGAGVGGSSTDDDPFGVEAMRRAQHGRTSSLWAKQKQPNTAVDSRVRNHSAAPSSQPRGVGRPAAPAATAPQPASRWGSVSTAPSSNVMPAASGGAPRASLVFGRKPPPSPQLSGQSSLPDLPPLTVGTADTALPPVSAPFATSSFSLGARTGFGLASVVGIPVTGGAGRGAGSRPNHSAGPAVRTLPLHPSASSLRSGAPPVHGRGSGTFAELGALDNGASGSFSRDKAPSRFSVASLVAFDLEAALRDRPSFAGRDSIVGPLSAEVWTADGAARLLLPLLPPQTAIGGLTSDSDPLGGGAPYSSSAARILRRRWVAVTSDDLLRCSKPTDVRPSLAHTVAPPPGILRQTSSQRRTLPSESALRTSSVSEAAAAPHPSERASLPAGSVAALVEKFSTFNAGKSAPFETAVLPDSSSSQRGGPARSSLPISTTGALRSASVATATPNVSWHNTSGRGNDSPLGDSFSLPEPAAIHQRAGDVEVQSPLCAIDWSSRPLGVYLPLEASLLQLSASIWIDRWRQKWDSQRGLRRSFSSSSSLACGGSSEVDADVFASTFRLSGVAPRDSSRQPFVPTCSLTSHAQDGGNRHDETGGADINTKIIVLFMHRLRVPSHEVAPFNSAMLLSTLPAHVLAQLPHTPDGSAIMSPSATPRLPKRVTRDVASFRSTRASDSSSIEAASMQASHAAAERVASLAFSPAPPPTPVNAVRVDNAMPGTWASIWLRDTSSFGRRRSSDASSAGFDGLFSATDAPPAVDRTKTARQSIVMSAATAGLAGLRDRGDSTVLGAGAISSMLHAGAGSMVPIPEESDHLRELEVTYSIQDAAAHALLVTAELACVDGLDRRAVSCMRDEMQETQLAWASDVQANVAHAAHAAQPTQSPSTTLPPPPPPRLPPNPNAPAPPPRKLMDPRAPAQFEAERPAATGLASQHLPSTKCTTCSSSSRFRAAFGFSPLPRVPGWLAPKSAPAASGCPRCYGTRLRRGDSSHSRSGERGVRARFSHSAVHWADATLCDMGLSVDDAARVCGDASSAQGLGLATALPQPSPPPSAPRSGNRSLPSSAYGLHLVVPVHLRPRRRVVTLKRSPQLCAMSQHDLLEKLLRNLGLRQSKAALWSRVLCSDAWPGRRTLCLRDGDAAPPPLDRASRVSAMARGSQGPTMRGRASIARGILRDAQQPQSRSSSTGVPALSSIPELPLALLWQGRVRVSWCHALAGHPALLFLDPSVTTGGYVGAASAGAPPVRQLLRTLVASSLPPGGAGGQRRVILSAHLAMSQVCSDWLTRRAPQTFAQHQVAPSGPVGGTATTRPVAPLGSVKCDVDFDAAFVDLITELLWPSLVPLRSRGEAFFSAGGRGGYPSGDTAIPPVFFAQVFADGSLRFMPCADEMLVAYPVSPLRWAPAAAQLLLPSLISTLQEGGVLDDEALHLDCPPAPLCVGGLWLPACLDAAPSRDLASPGHAVEVVLRAGFLTLIPCDPQEARRLLCALQVAASQPVVSVTIPGVPGNVAESKSGDLQQRTFFSELVKSLSVHGLAANFSGSQMSAAAAAAATKAQSLAPSACRAAAAASAMSSAGPMASVAPDRITPLAIIAALSPGSETAAAGLTTAAAADTATAALTAGLAAGIVQQTSLSLATASLQKRGLINRGYKPRTLQALVSYRLPSASMAAVTVLAQLLALQKRVLAANLARRHDAAGTACSTSASPRHSTVPELPRSPSVSVVASLLSAVAKVVSRPAGLDDGDKVDVSDGDSMSTSGFPNRVGEPAMPSSAVVAGASPAPQTPQPRRSFFMRSPRVPNPPSGGRPRREGSSSSLGGKQPPGASHSSRQMAAVPAQDVRTPPPLSPHVIRTLDAWASIVACHLPLGFADVHVLPTVASMLASDDVLPPPLCALLLAAPGEAATLTAPPGVLVAGMAGESMAMCLRFLLRVRSRNILRVLALPSLHASGVITLAGADGAASAAPTPGNLRSSGEPDAPELLSPLRLLRSLRATASSPIANEVVGGRAPPLAPSVVSAILCHSPAAALLFGMSCLVDVTGSSVSVAYFKRMKASGAKVPRGVISLLADGESCVRNATVRLPAPVSRVAASTATGLAQVLLNLQRQNIRHQIAGGGLKPSGLSADGVGEASDASSAPGDLRGGFFGLFHRKRNSSGAASPETLPSVMSSVNADMSLPDVLLHVVTVDRTWEFAIPTSESAVAAELIMLLRIFKQGRLESWRKRLLLASGPQGSAGTGLSSAGLAGAAATLSAASSAATGSSGSVLGLGTVGGLASLMGHSCDGPPVLPSAMPAGDSYAGGPRDFDLQQWRYADVAHSTAPSAALGAVNPSAFDEALTPLQSFGVPVQRISLDPTAQWEAIAGAILDDYAVRK